MCITEVVICRTVLHITHFGVFHYLQDIPAYNHSDYRQDRAAYNMSLTDIRYI